jgi:hypothetical protein
MGPWHRKRNRIAGDGKCISNVGEQTRAGRPRGDRQAGRRRLSDRLAYPDSLGRTCRMMGKEPVTQSRIPVLP